MAADGKKTEASIVGVNSDFVDPEGNVYGLLHPFEHAPTIQFEDAGSMTVVDVPLVPEPTSILNARRDVLVPCVTFEHAPTIQFEHTSGITLVSEPTRDEVLAPVNMEIEAAGVQDDSPGVQNNQPVQGQVTSVRRSNRQRNQPIYNELLLANRLPRRAPANRTRSSNRRETLRELHTSPLPRRARVLMMRASNDPTLREPIHNEQLPRRLPAIIRAPIRRP